MTTWPRWMRALAVVGGVCVASITCLPQIEAQAIGPNELFRIHDGRVLESSSLVVSAVHPGLVYTANDSGDGAYVYTVDMSSGDTVGVTTLSGVRPTDVEAMAPGSGGRLFIADIGDNTGTRHDVTVYWIDQPGAGDATVNWHSATLAYPDGPHDAETLLVDPSSGRLFVVSKELFGGTIYAAPYPLSQDHVNGLQPVGSAPGLVTDGAFLPSGLVVLRTYTAAQLYDPAHWKPLSSTSLPRQQQGESVAALGGSAEVLVGSEGVNSQVYKVRLDVHGRVIDDQPTRVHVRPGAQPRPGGGAVDQPAAPPVAAVDASQVDQSLAAPVVLLVGLLTSAGAVVLVRRRSGHR